TKKRKGSPDPAQPSKAEAPASAPTSLPHGQVVVGIGASAGGLAALKRFFATVPADTGLAFAIVVHLSPEHESYLADLLQPLAAIPVTQVMEETPIEPNHAYVIPPGRSLSAVDSHLRIAPLASPRLGRAPVDHFFRTLAETHDGESVGVILSGTGSDGAHGIGYLREHGGMTVAQDPAEAEFDGMPRSAIATGLVDHVLPIAAMVQRIREFAATRPLVVRPDASGSRASDEAAPDGAAADELEHALTLVRLRTGHDFLRYKRSTVARRIARRMQVLNLVQTADYVERLRTDEQEASALLDDLLINVTSFFRDSDVFRGLEADVIPGLFEGKGRNDVVRVWSVGCATGEEAYTIGMLLLEEAGRRNNAPQVQIFATDLHERSLEKGREAVFTDAIESEISPERLDRFFRREGGGYRVTKSLRDVVVFAMHNLLRDPPFSRLDFVVCRNVLIYLQRDLQNDVIDLFHYSLSPGGLVLLGTAETLVCPDLFRAENKEIHLYRRRDVPHGAIRLPALAMSPRVRRAPGEIPELPAAAPAKNTTTYARVHQQLVERYGTPSLLVGPGHEVVHLSDGVGRFLRHPGGQPTNDLFKLVRDEFRMELRSGMHVARNRRTAWASRPIIVALDGAVSSVTVRATPASEPELEGYVLVLFDESDRTSAPPASARSPGDENVRELEAELESTRGRMQALIEEFETTQEESRASNEELQSTNEELRSTLEELETSREELQSVNEELQTLNQENRHKVEELSQLSSDLQNLLQSTDIATIFLDRNLRILRYTPRVTEIFNVRHADRGRPLADLTHRLGYPDLIDDAKRVLQTLVPVEREAEMLDPPASYLLRSAPYRTVDDRIEGIVITMVDVTALKRTQGALRRSEERQALLVRLHDTTRPISDPVEMQRVASRLLGEHLRANRVSYVEVEEQAVVSRAPYTRDVKALPPEYPLAEFDAAYRPGYHRGESLVVSDVVGEERLTDDEREAYRAADVGSLVAVMFERSGERLAGFSVHDREPRTWTPEEVALIREFGARTAVAVDRARAESTLRASEERFRLIVDGARDYAIVTTDLDGRILTWSPGAEAVHGWTSDEMIGQSIDVLFTPDDRADGVPERERAQTVEHGAAADTRWHMRKNGSRVFIDGVSRPVTEGAGKVARILRFGQDVTARRQMEQALRELNATLEQRVGERTEQLAEANRSARSERVFLRRLAQGEEDERRRLARDLHDEAGQLLTALGLGLQTMSDLAAPGSAMAHHAAKLRDLADTISRELHAVAVRLRPKALDDFGLEAALRTYIDEWARSSGIFAVVHAPAEVTRLPEAVETAIYRIVQEALTNVARHSGARRASVVVERRGSEVVAIIEDEGRGFDLAVVDGATVPGLGLRGIRERAALLGGTAEIESAEGAGTTIFIRIPIDDDGTDSENSSGT
ncbi:MAG TPA: chemotaxis protein CheB, partial [Gemmatimonadaceae bacterium]|nr:chemotaxis protein CheB [Gemmatimonadaceae bacterium]